MWTCSIPAPQLQGLDADISVITSSGSLQEQSARTGCGQEQESSLARICWLAVQGVDFSDALDDPKAPIRPIRQTLSMVLAAFESALVMAQLSVD